MAEKAKWTGSFVKHLESLRDQNNRGALAQLRRGLGKPPGHAPEMHPHVVPWLPDWLGRRERGNAYLVAALFAMHPQEGGKGSLGATFSRIQPRSDSAEARFVALMRSNQEDLGERLRGAVSLLSANSVPVDWEQLLRDMNYWDHEDRFVQWKWAQDYWEKAAGEQAGGEKGEVEAAS